MLYCRPGCLQNAECSANLGPSSCKIVNVLQIWDPSEDLEKAPEKAPEKAEESNLEKASGETTGESRFLWRKYFFKVTYSSSCEDFSLRAASTPLGQIEGTVLRA